MNALALVAKHPEDVRIARGARATARRRSCPTARTRKAAARAIHDTYQRSGFGAGMAHFIAVVSHQGAFPDDFAQQPAPDPAMFGMPTEDDGSRTDPLLGAEHDRSGTHYEPDFDALRNASTRIVIAAGVESEGEMANRGAYRVADRLGHQTVIFPSDHGGFLGGEYGQAGEPDAFAAKLREVLGA